jgi:3-methyladenine DNA glycosylase AlkD
MLSMIKMKQTAKIVKNELQKYADTNKAATHSRFFKTGKGEYGEGDVFIGVTNPNMRKVGKQLFKEIEFAELQKLIQDKIHEYRLTALIMLVYKFQKSKSKEERKKIYDFYLKNLKYVNNWDLVDLSAHYIVGAYLFEYDGDRKVLYQLAMKNELWKQRVAIMSTFYFIKQGDFDDTLKIAEILLNHEHDLIHKAVGWMLREIGKRDVSVEKKFLHKFYKQMPRTMLRYAIEKFPEEERQRYLKGLV